MSSLPTGVIIVDHGSRRDQSNQLLEELVRCFADRFSREHQIVEPAHMELAEPSIGSAFDRCVQRGARRVIVCPFFLGPGKHWTQDIPRLTADAAARHPGTRYHVTPTLGIDELILELLQKRISTCQANDYRCDICKESLRNDDPAPAS